MKTNKKTNVSHLEEELNVALDKLDIPLSQQERQLIREAIIKMEREQMLPREAIGCTPEMMEMIYNHAYQLFYAGKYKEALPVFLSLRELDPKDPRYSFAIATCYHRNKEYLDAAANYILSHSLDPSEPLSRFYLYDCFMKANHPLSALIAIQEALVLVENNPKYQELKPKIELEYENFKIFLDAYLSKKNK